MGTSTEEGSGVRRVGRDPAAFEEFYRRHVGEVLRFVTRRVDSPHDAADLTAEVFLRVIDGADRYRGGPGGARGWLYGIARNVVASSRRDSARQRGNETRVAGHRLLDGDDFVRVEEQIDAARRVAALADELSALPEGERAVLELVSYDGLTVTEAAAALGIRPTAARVRLHRARRAAQRLAAPPALAIVHVRPQPEAKS
ncbi:MAG TPA: sigma-70 family RNA polymerase sigma factor [Mycobacteriales bacterium]|nr:sigma-70 family RNA polymerase sigma factor [Mycobacteriales bacterium]